MKNETLSNLTLQLSSAKEYQDKAYSEAHTNKNWSVYYNCCEHINELTAEIEYRRFGELVTSGD